MIKCEIKVDKILFPKNTDFVGPNLFTVFLAQVLSVIDGVYSSNSIKLKGKLGKTIKIGTKFNVIAVLKPDQKYKDTYEIIGSEFPSELSNTEGLKVFLSSIVNENTAEDIVSSIPNIIEVLDNKDVETLKKVKGIGDIKAVKIIEKYNQIKNYEKAISTLSSFGLSNSLISKIVDHYGNNELAINSVMSNPYNLTKINGIGFKMADTIAKKINIPEYEEKRIDGFIYYTLETEGEKGKSYLSYRELLKLATKTIEEITEESLIRHINSLEKQGDIIRIGDGNSICLTKYYEMEKKIAEELIRIYENCNIIIENEDKINSVIEAIENERGIELTNQQKEVIAYSARYGVLAVTGLAGTGKTTTAYGICLLHNDKKILSIALSGKASVRISEITGIEPSTIHKALKYNNGKYYYTKNNPLDVDVVIIDEATMINGDLFLALLEAIPSGAKLVMYGDVQQLTPIGNCNVFSDILKSNAFPCVRLTEPHRQALKSGIIPVSLRIANQQQLLIPSFVGTMTFGEEDDVEINVLKDSDKMAEYIVKIFQREYMKNPNILEVQILTPMRLNGNINCYVINNLIQDIYNPNYDGEYLEVILETKKNAKKSYKIKVGDKVINTRNNYNTYNVDGEKTPIFNGNIGIVTEIDSSSCVVDFVGIGKVIIEEENVRNLELAYAISVHKSQGSGFDNVIIAIDNSSYVLNNVELLYTAITRAKKFCSLIAVNKALRIAINTKETTVKQTLLKILLLRNGGPFFI